jgi:hypothetical protein
MWSDVVRGGQRCSGGNREGPKERTAPSKQVIHHEFDKHQVDCRPHKLRSACSINRRHAGTNRTSDIRHDLARGICIAL